MPRRGPPKPKHEIPPIHGRTFRLRGTNRPVRTTPVVPYCGDVWRFRPPCTRRMIRSSAAEGGKVAVEPTQISGVGEFALFQDLDGNTVGMLAMT
jgi:hypothetical protein